MAAPSWLGRRASGRQVTLISVLAALVFCIFVLEYHPSPGPYQGPDVPAATVKPHEVWPQVAFLGDSYTAGSDMGGYGASGYPALLAAKHRWYPNLFAVGGSGYLNGGQAISTIRDRVPGVVALQPEVIIVSAGHNDVGVYPPAQVVDEARRVLTALRAGCPKATIVVVGPIWPNGETPPGLLAVRDGIEGVAKDSGLAFIDPVAEGWFAGSNERFIGSDRVHPTNQGHQHLTDVLDAHLTQLGVGATT
jgi:lysophospholipase L1-like esterase